MIKQWMEFCAALSPAQDAKRTAEQIGDALALKRGALADTFYQLSIDLPRKQALTVFVRTDSGTYIATFEAYTMTDAKLMALKLAKESTPGSEHYDVIGVADGDITVLEWNDYI